MAAAYLIIADTYSIVVADVTIRLVMDARMDTRRPREYVRQNAPSLVGPFSLSGKNTCFGKGFFPVVGNGGERL